MRMKEPVLYTFFPEHDAPPRFTFDCHWRTGCPNRAAYAVGDLGGGFAPSFFSSDPIPSLDTHGQTLVWLQGGAP